MNHTFPRTPPPRAASPLRPRCGAAICAALAGLASLAPPQAQALPSIPSRNLDLVAHFNDFPSTGGRYSSCWHYVHGDGREYAIIGHQRGIGIYNVTNPTAAYLVDSIPGPANGWREMKSYRNWIYVVSEANGVAGAGLQIVRMTDPENPVLAATYTATFTSAHTVTIDTTRALLFANGTRLSNGTAAGMRILSLANPQAPVEVGRWPAVALPVPQGQYVHDASIRGTTLYAAAIYGGGVRVIDTTNPAGAFESANFGYWDARLPHNTWPDASGQYLYVTDETNGMPLAVFDVSSYTTPFKLPVYEWTSNPQAVVHNAHVNGNDLWLAHYTEGVHVLDATDPRHPAAFGHADTYAGPTGGYKGCWGVDPYFPSGLAIASDMSTGLYVFQVRRDYGVVRVEVTDAASTEPMDSVWVYGVTQGDSLQTPFYGDGIVAFAPSPGLHTFVVKRFGYRTATLSVTVAQGSFQTIPVALELAPTVNLSGTVRDATTLAVLADAEVELSYTPIHAHSDAAGQYALADVPDDSYRVAVRRPGYIPVTFVRRIGPVDGTQDFQLQPVAAWDHVQSGAGWSVLTAPNESHVASSGRWQLARPNGTYYGSPLGAARTGSARLDAHGSSARAEPIRPPIGPLHDDDEGSAATVGQVQTGAARSPLPDSLCFVTGNGPASLGYVIDAADVDSTTTLTSAAYDLTGMTTPMIAVWLWFYSQFRHPDDFMAVLVSNDNGATWAPMDTLRGARNRWAEHNYRIADFVTPTALVRLRFVAVDGGEPSVVECAVDDVSVYDGATAPLGVLEGGPPASLRFLAVWPNPARDDVRLVLALPQAEVATVDVLDVAGRRVRVLHRGATRAGTLTLQWDGTDDRGRVAAAGLYWVRARVGASVAQSRFVRAR